MKVFTHSLSLTSVTQSCPTLCNPMNRSTPGLPVHHQLPEFTQTHAHQVGDIKSSQKSSNAKEKLHNCCQSLFIQIIFHTSILKTLLSKNFKLSQDTSY